MKIKPELSKRNGKRKYYFNIILVLFIIYVLFLIIHITVKEPISLLLDYLLPAITLFLAVINSKVYRDNKEFCTMDFNGLEAADFILRPQKILGARGRLREILSYANTKGIIIKNLFNDDSSRVNEISYSLKSGKIKVEVLKEIVKKNYRGLTKGTFLLVTIFLILAMVVGKSDINWPLTLISIYSLMVLIIKNLIGTKNIYILQQELNYSDIETQVNDTLIMLMPYKIHDISMVENKGKLNIFICFCTEVRRYALFVAVFIIPVLIYMAHFFLSGIFYPERGFEQLMGVLPSLLLLLAVFQDEQDIIALTDQYYMEVRNDKNSKTEGEIKKEIYLERRSDRIRKIEFIKRTETNRYIFISYALDREIQILRKIACIQRKNEDAN